jgi:c-di-GMP-binding flagellar brake protein YcgR
MTLIRDVFRQDNLVGIEISTGQHPGLYTAKIQVAREDIIGTSVPVLGGRMCRLSKGDKVNLVPLAADEADRFATTVTNFFPTPVSLYIFDNPDCEFGADKRAWPRVDTQLSMEYFSLAEGKRSFLPGTASNISGGGLLLDTKDKMQTGERLIVKLSLEKYGLVSATCQVVRSIEKEGADGIHHFCGLNFVDILDEDRQKILDFIALQLKSAK